MSGKSLHASPYLCCNQWRIRLKRSRVHCRVPRLWVRRLQPHFDISNLKFLVTLVNINNANPSSRPHFVEILCFSIALQLYSYINETMDYSQTFLRVDRYEGLGFALTSNVSMPTLFRINRSVQANYTPAQIALLFIPSAVFLLLFPIRAFQLGRASLKVLPNYTGALKAVGCSRGRVKHGVC